MRAEKTPQGNPCGSPSIVAGGPAAGEVEVGPSQPSSASTSTRGSSSAGSPPSSGSTGTTPPASTARSATCHPSSTRPSGTPRTPRPPPNDPDCTKPEVAQSALPASAERQLLALGKALGRDLHPGLARGEAIEQAEVPVRGTRVHLEHRTGNTGNRMVDLSQDVLAPAPSDAVPSVGKGPLVGLENRVWIDEGVAGREDEPSIAGALDPGPSPGEQRRRVEVPCRRRRRH